MFLHTVNANLIEFLHCSTSNAMIKHLVQNFLKGLNPALTYLFFCKPTNSKRIAWVSSKTRVFLAGWDFIGLARSQYKSNLVSFLLFLLFKCSEVLL